MNKLFRSLLVLVVLAVIATGGYLAWQKSQREKNQVKLLKTANESYLDDQRYISFGTDSDYTFAVPKSYTVSESSTPGVKFLIPGGVDSTTLDSPEKTFDASVVAIEAISNVKPFDNKAIKNHVKNTVLPEVKKTASEDIKTVYAYTGKYRSATITATKDGRQVRQVFVYGGARPYMAVSGTKSDAFLEVINTLISVNDSNIKDDTALIKPVVTATITLLKEGKLQQLYDSASSEFKKKASLNQLTSAVNDSKNDLSRDVLVPGGNIAGNQFFCTLSFQPIEKDGKSTLGSLNLIKEDNQWKLQGLTLPTSSTPSTPTPKKK